MEKRFTVVELVVVLAITGILIVAVGCRARRVHRSSCIGNLHGLGVGYTMYVNDYGAWPTGDVAGGSSKECLYLVYDAYTESKDPYSCPASPTTVIVPGASSRS